MIQLPDAAQQGKYHVAVCIPSHETLPYQFANSLANMLGYSVHEIGDMVNITTHWCVGTYVHRAREQLVREIAQMGAHYILWLDSDHDFPKDLLIRLLAHDKAMVGINYATRGVPVRYVGIKRASIDHPDDPALLETTEESTGLEETEALGFGAVLMKTAILPTLPEDGPWFFFEYNFEEGIHVGEDVYFCRLVRQAGWEIHCDHDLSKECTHVGQIAYRLNHVWAMEEDGLNVDHYIQRTTDGDSELAESDGSDDSDPDLHPASGSEVEAG